MNFIPKIAHGYIDYILAVLLICLPLFFNLNYNHAQGNVPIIAGCFIIFYSLLTNYKMGPLKLIPFKAHLVMDGLTGLFLMASPWLFGFYENFYSLHLSFGAVIVLVALFTDKVYNDLYF